jgi:hypothetical protein
MLSFRLSILYYEISSKDVKRVEEISSKDVKQEEKMASDGDLDSEKKGKKKRGRVDNDDHMLEQVEHTKKNFCMLL